MTGLGHGPIYSSPTPMTSVPRGGYLSDHNAIHMAWRETTPLQAGNGGVEKLGDSGRDWYVANYVPAVTKGCASSMVITNR